MARALSNTKKIANFIDSLDDKIYKESSDFKTIVERALKISLDEYSNLYVLKYHVESDMDKDMDKCLIFLNRLIDLYTQGQIFEVQQIKSIKEFYGLDISSKERYERLTYQLKENAGIINGPHNSTKYKDNKVIVEKKEIVVQEDGSVLYHVKSTRELVDFRNNLFEKYTYLYDRVRSEDIKSKFDRLEVDNFFEGHTESYICVAKYSQDFIRFTVLGKRYKVDNKERDGIFQFDNHTVLGISVGVCTI